MLTKTKFSPHEALDLGLITQLASEEDIENTCIGKLKELSELPSHAIIETRNLFHPDVSVIEKHLDEFSKSSIRSLYKMQS
jgi:enoyl-CoA hydratase/carnithine racemase